MNKSLFLYIFGRGVKGLIPFLVIPIILRVISERDFGFYSYLEALILLGSQVVLFGSHQIAVEKYNGYSFKSILKKTTIFLALNACILGIVSSYFLLEKVSYDVFAYALLITFFLALNTLQVSLEKVAGRAKNILVIDSLGTLVRFCGGALLAIYVLSNFYSLLLSWIIALVGMSVAYSFLHARDLCYSECLKSKSIKLSDLYSIGHLVLIYSLSVYVVSVIDRVMLESLSNLDAVARYSVGYKLGGIPQIFYTAAVASMLPKIYNGKISRVNQLVSFKYVACLALITLLVGILSYFYVQFFLPVSMASSFYVCTFVLMGYFFHGICAALYHLLNLNKKRLELALLGIFVAALNVLFNFFLIPEGDEMGAAIATMLSYFALFLGMILLSRSLREKSLL